MKFSNLRTYGTFATYGRLAVLFVRFSCCWRPELISSLKKLYSSERRRGALESISITVMVVGARAWPVACTELSLWTADSGAADRQITG